MKIAITTETRIDSDFIQCMTKRKEFLIKTLNRFAITKFSKLTVPF